MFKFFLKQFKGLTCIMCISYPQMKGEGQFISLFSLFYFCKRPVCVDNLSSHDIF